MKKLPFVLSFPRGTVFLAALVFRVLIFDALDSQRAEAGNFTAINPMITSHYQPTATLLTNGLVLIAGGFDQNGAVTDDSELYDPANGTWTPTGVLINARIGHTATLLQDGRVLVTGGWNTNGYLMDTELFDPTTKIWMTNAPMASARYGHTATRLCNGQVLIVGGIDATGRLASTELFDPASGTFETNNPIHVARYVHTATLLKSGQVLIAGGFLNNSGFPLDRADLYDPNTGTWTVPKPMNTARAWHTATLLPNGQVLMAGGILQYPGNNSEIFDPVTGSWTPTAPLNTPRFFHTATLLPNGLVLVAGGCDPSPTDFGTAYSSTELYAPNAGIWISNSPLVTARDEHTATLLPNGKVLIAGGGNLISGYLSSAEIYSGVTACRFTDTVRTEGGAMQLNFTNVPEATFLALGTTNLTQPLSDWTVLGSATEVSSGQYQFTDPQAGNFPQRFYRIISP